MIVEIEISNITVPQGLLPRILTGTIEEKVNEYKEAYETGQDMPPISLWKNNNQYWIIDGVHRTEAQKRLGKNTLRAKILELKNETEYRMEAIRLNKHGIPLQKSEKEQLAINLAKIGVSVNELCKLFSVSERTIYRWLGDFINEKEIKRLEFINKAKDMKEEGLTQEEIARELGVSQSNISKIFQTDTMAEWNNSTLEINNLYSNTPINLDEIISIKEFHKEGKNIEEISNEFMRSENEINDILDSSIDDGIITKGSNGGRPISKPEKLAPFDKDGQLEIRKNNIETSLAYIAGVWGYDTAIQLCNDFISYLNKEWKNHPGTGHPKAILPRY